MILIKHRYDHQANHDVVEEVPSTLKLSKLDCDLWQILIM